MNTPADTRRPRGKRKEKRRRRRSRRRRQNKTTPRLNQFSFFSLPKSCWLCRMEEEKEKKTKKNKKKRAGGVFYLKRNADSSAA
jgi:hypothetical protein